MSILTLYGTILPLVQISRAGFYVVLVNGREFNMPRRAVKMIVKGAK
jgi:hypothetical protein